MVRQVALFVWAGGAWPHILSVQFFRLPIQDAADFRPTEPGLLSMDEAQAIAAALARGGVQGIAGRYLWKSERLPA